MPLRLLGQSSNMTAFANQLAYGRAAESAIARWLRSKGRTVLPVYEKIFDDGKGPQVFTPKDSLVAPDLLVWKDDRATWIEAKHKTAFTWHRITGRWVTGIDLRHYEHYLKVAQSSPWPVWLLFLHEGGHAKDSPETSPAGLFGNELLYLSRNVNHKSDKWGRSGMVYWARQTLKKLANLDTIA